MIKMWVKIDRLRLYDRPFLNESDECYFARERLVGGSFRDSDGNQLITNLQIPLNETHRLQHKTAAIRQFAQELNYFPFEKNSYIMPMPSSKTEDHPEYDNRIERVCRLFCKNQDLGVKFLCPIVNTVDFKSSKSGGTRSVQAFKDAYMCELLPSDCINVYIVDDALTMGTHFRATADLLRESKSDLNIFGLFWVINVHKLSE